MKIPAAIYEHAEAAIQCDVRNVDIQNVFCIILHKLLGEFSLLIKTTTINKLIFIIRVLKLTIHH